MERDTLWRRVVGEKYGSVWGGWCMNAVKGLCGFSFRKFISQEWAFFLQHLQFELGDGTKVKSCYDLWNGEFQLKVAYAKLFSIT